MVVVYFDPLTREKWTEWGEAMEEPSWAVSGRFKLAQVAKKPEEGQGARRATKRTSSKFDVVWLYFSHEVEAERVFHFPSIDVCPRKRRGLGIPTWKECSWKEGCHAKHACEFSLGNILWKVNPLEGEGQLGDEEVSVLRLGEAEQGAVCTLLHQRFRDYRDFYGEAPEGPDMVDQEEGREV